MRTPIDLNQDVPGDPVAVAMHPDVVGWFRESFPEYSEIPMLLSQAFPNHDTVYLVHSGDGAIRSLVELANGAIAFVEEMAHVR